MQHRVLAHYRGWAIWGLVLTLFSHSLQAFELPECSPLAQWAGQLKPDETFELAPEVKITTLLRDELTGPLFGAPVTQWTRTDVAALRRQLNQCRKQAHRAKDQALGDAFYQALKALDGARGPLMQQAQVRANIAMNVDRLMKYRPSQRLERQLALSQAALQGEAVDLQAFGLHRLPGWIPQFQQASAFLGAEEVAAFVAQLEARRSEMQTQFQATEDAYAEAQQALADVPVDRAGLATLNELERLPLLNELSPEEIDGFRGEINRKRSAIHAKMRAQEQAQQAQRQRQAQQALIDDIDTHLAGLLKGDTLDTLQLLDLQPGVSHAQALNQVQRRSGYRQTLSLSMTPAFGKGASLIEFKKMEQAVGELDLTERFKFPLDMARVRDALVARFGEPEGTEPIPGGQMLTWRGDGQVLQVLTTNRVHNAVAYKGYRSRLSIGLWSRAYEGHLQEVNRRCGELYDKPRNQLSRNEAVYLGSNCPLVPGNKQEPGLIRVM